MNTAPAPPAQFVCPLSNQLMRHPVMDGSAVALEDDSSNNSTAVCYERSIVLKAFGAATTGAWILNKELQWKIKYWVKKNYHGSFDAANAAIALERKPTVYKMVPQVSVKTILTTTLSTSSAPSHFYCPLSQQIMDDPVHSKNNPTVSFERQELFKWLSVDAFCPVTGQPLSRKSLVRNTALADEIEAWRYDTAGGRRHQTTTTPSTTSASTSLDTTKQLYSSNMAARSTSSMLPPIAALLDSLPTSRTRRTAASAADRMDNLLALLDEAIECSTGGK